jgi:hypothetical protein
VSIADDLVYPTGMNLVDSARIDELYQVLSKPNVDEDVVRLRLSELTPADRAAIKSVAMANTWRWVLSRLNNEMLRRDIEEKLGI